MGGGETLPPSGARDREFVPVFQKTPEQREVNLRTMTSPFIPKVYESRSGDAAARGKYEIPRDRNGTTAAT